MLLYDCLYVVRLWSVLYVTCILHQTEFCAISQFLHWNNVYHSKLMIMYQVDAVVTNATDHQP